MELQGMGEAQKKCQHMINDDFFFVESHNTIKIYELIFDN